MTRARTGTTLRDNTSIVAAVALPVVVGAFFLLPSAVPRWTMPAPAHDLVLKVQKPYDQTRPTLAVDFVVRNGIVAATLLQFPTRRAPRS